MPWKYSLPFIVFFLRCVLKVYLSRHTLFACSRPAKRALPDVTQRFRKDHVPERRELWEEFTSQSSAVKCPVRFRHRFYDYPVAGDSLEK